MEQSLCYKGAARTTEHHQQLTDYLLDKRYEQEGLIVIMMLIMQTETNTTMMKKMIWVITLIAISTKPISAFNHLKNRVGRGSICSISQSIGFTHHY